MSALPHLVIERTTHVTPFGLGLWDVACGRLTSDEIEVRVHTMLEGRVVRSVVARPNRHDLFVAQEFQELRAFESGAGDEAFWIAQPAPLPFLIEVFDPTGRFTSFVMQLSLPKRGLATPACPLDMWPLASPPQSPVWAEPPAYVPLLSTPARAVPAGLASVRATLVNAVDGAAAAWAVLEVQHADTLVARGIADHRGEVLAVFAYPEPPAPAPSSPGGGPEAPQPLANASWPLEIAVRYDPGLTLHRLGRRRAPLADLCELFQQPLAMARTSSPPAPLTGALLRYGQELVVGADAGATLFIDPA